MKMYRLLLRRRLWWRVAAGAAMAGGLLAELSPALLAQQGASQHRSLTDVRERIPDEHDRPYFRETQSHRGWEIREPQFTIVADTSAADARWAAAQAAQGWQQASKLADRWTTAHHNPDFGLSGLQITISNEPLRDRDAPLTTVNVVGIQTNVQINVAPGQPSLNQQVARLREGAAFAMLHAAGVDAAAPPWVVDGLAAVAGRTGLSDDELKPNAAVDAVARVGGQQWRYSRATEDTLAYPSLDHEEAAARVAFLLKGNDAEHAPLLLAALQQTTADAGQSAAAGKGFATFPGNSQLPSSTAVDEVMGQLQSKFVAWREHPHAGEPVFEPTADTPPELVAAEREMLVILKLERRLGTGGAATGKPAAGGLATTIIDRGSVRTKIITFDRAKGASVNEPFQRAAAPLSFAAFTDRLTDANRPAWATLDVDGSLLLSTDTARVQSLLDAAAQRYSLENNAGQTILVRRLENGQALRGALVNNPKDQSRPLAKFEVASYRRRPKTIELPRPQGQVTAVPPAR
jgi:hypothetical protein